MPRFTRSRFTTKTLHNSSTNRYKQRTTKGDHKRSLLNTRDPTKNEIVWWGIGGAKMRERDGIVCDVIPGKKKNIQRKENMTTQKKREEGTTYGKRSQKWQK